MVTEILLGSESTTYNYGEWSNMFILQRFQAAKSGTIKEIRVYNSENSNYGMFAIYADNSGEPGDLLASTASILLNVIFNWKTISISDVAITAGSYYWIGFNNSNASGMKMRESASTSRRKDSTYSSFSFPDPAGSGFTSMTTHDVLIAAWGEAAKPAANVIWIG